MARIIVSGSLAYDRIMDYPGLFAEHILTDKAHSINVSFQVDTLSVEFGGTAGNVAYSLALLSEHPEIIATVGNDFDEYRSHLASLGIDLASVREREGERTASAFIFTDTGDNQIAAFYFGAGAHPYEGLVETDGRLLAIVSAGCIADMTVLPKHYRKQGLRYLYDPGQAIPALSGETLENGISGAAVVFVSDYELSLIAAKTGLDEGGILERAEHLVVTLGASGSKIFGKDGVVHVPAVSGVSALDPTGAGDAYRAGFIKGLALDLPLVSCGRLGSVVAACAVECYGTQAHRFRREEIADRYYSAYGEKLDILRQ